MKMVRDQVGSHWDLLGFIRICQDPLGFIGIQQELSWKSLGIVRNQVRVRLGWHNGIMLPSRVSNLGLMPGPSNQ